MRRMEGFGVLNCRGRQRIRQLANPATLAFAQAPCCAIVAIDKATAP